MKASLAPERVEYSVDLRSMQEWLHFRDSRAELLDHHTFEKWGSQIASNGCVEPLTGWRLLGHELENPTLLREGLTYHGICARVRGVMLAIERLVQQQQLHSPAIYAAEAVTAFALRLRGIYPRFLGSEFTLDHVQQKAMYPIPCEDLQALTLASDSFDIVSTNEVLEHVPSIDKALREMHRVLRPGGWHVGTVPFNFFGETSLRRAMLEDDGTITYLLEPEYHGDPMNDGGVLVFEIPGWDILDRARAAGFSDAFMQYVVSLEHGVLAEHAGGVFLLCCQK